MTTKDEIKNRISMALKDSVLQMGFEIICRENDKLEKENGKLKAQLTKAKEILKGIIDTPMYNQMGGETYENEEYKELITEAEQFLEGAEND